MYLFKHLRVEWDIIVAGVSTGDVNKINILYQPLQPTHITLLRHSHTGLEGGDWVLGHNLCATPA